MVIRTYVHHVCVVSGWNFACTIHARLSVSEKGQHSSCVSTSGNQTTPASAVTSLSDQARHTNTHSTINRIRTLKSNKLHQNI